MHHVVKDHIFIVLLSCEKKKKKLSTSSHLYEKTRTSLQPTTDYFENESNIYCQNINKLLLTISKAASEGLGPTIETRSDYTILARFCHDLLDVESFGNN